MSHPLLTQYGQKRLNDVHARLLEASQYLDLVANRDHRRGQIAGVLCALVDDEKISQAIANAGTKDAFVQAIRLKDFEVLSQDGGDDPAGCNINGHDRFNICLRLLVAGSVFEVSADVIFVPEEGNEFSYDGIAYLVDGLLPYEFHNDYSKKAADLLFQEYFLNERREDAPVLGQDPFPRGTLDTLINVATP